LGFVIYDLHPSGAAMPIFTDSERSKRLWLGEYSGLTVRCSMRPPMFMRRPNKGQVPQPLLGVVDTDEGTLADFPGSQPTRFDFLVGGRSTDAIAI